MVNALRPSKASTRGKAIKSVEDHHWYKVLRETYPNTQECWPWIYSGQAQVDAGAFREDAGKKIGARKYLYQELVKGPIEDPYPAADCEPRCVNPWHASENSRERSSIIRQKDKPKRTVKYVCDIVQMLYLMYDVKDKQVKDLKTAKKIWLSYEDEPMIDSDWTAFSAKVAEAVVLRIPYSVSVATGIAASLGFTVVIDTGDGEWTEWGAP